jgi:hypothetical protein
MRRVALIAFSLLAAFGVSGCVMWIPTGVDQVGQTSARVSGVLVSNEGGPASYLAYFRSPVDHEETTGRKGADLDLHNGQTFSLTMPRLRPSTTYHYRMCGEQQPSVSWCSSEGTFTTLQGTPFRVVPGCVARPGDPVTISYGPAPSLTEFQRLKTALANDDRTAITYTGVNPDEPLVEHVGVTDLTFDDDRLMFTATPTEGPPETSTFRWIVNGGAFYLTGGIRVGLCGNALDPP